MTRTTYQWQGNYGIHRDNTYIKIFTTANKRTYPWHRYFEKVNQVMMATEIFWRDNSNSNSTNRNTGIGNSSLAVTLHQGNHDRNHNLWNTVSTVIYILHMQVLPECCYIEKESSQWENWNHLFVIEFRSYSTSTDTLYLHEYIFPDYFTKLVTQ